MDNVNKIAPQEKSEKKEASPIVSEFLSENLESIEQVKNKAYYLEEEFAKTKKNKSIRIVFMIIISILLVAGITAGTAKLLNNQTRKISLDISDFDDINLKNLLDLATKTQESLEQASQKLAIIEGTMNTELENEDIALKNKIAAINATLGTERDKSVKRNKAKTNSQKVKDEISQKYANEINILKSEITTLQEQMSKFDATRIEESEKQKVLLDSKEQLFENEKKEIQKENAKMIAELENTIEKMKKDTDTLLQENIKSVSESYKNKIVSLDPRLQDSKANSILNSINLVAKAIPKPIETQIAENIAPDVKTTETTDVATTDNKISPDVATDVDATNAETTSDIATTNAETASDVATTDAETASDIDATNAEIATDVDATNAETTSDVTTDVPETTSDIATDIDATNAETASDVATTNAEIATDVATDVDATDAEISSDVATDVDATNTESIKQKTETKNDYTESKNSKASIKKDAENAQYLISKLSAIPFENGASRYLQGITTLLKRIQTQADDSISTQNQKVLVLEQEKQNLEKSINTIKSGLYSVIKENEAVGIILDPTKTTSIEILLLPEFETKAIGQTFEIYNKKNKAVGTISVLPHSYNLLSCQIKAAVSQTILLSDLSPVSGKYF